jgi:hypothetical protein
MSLEAAVVLDVINEVLYWHLPKDRGPGYIPDTRKLWEVLWDNRGNLGSVVHSHPGQGLPQPSHTDITTFAAIEAALGKRIRWGIITHDQLAYFEWKGPGEHDYICTDMHNYDPTIEWLKHLHKHSYGGIANGQ